MTDLATYDCRIGGRCHTISYRPGTTDENVLRQVWQDQEYDLTNLPCWDDVLTFYRVAAQAGRFPLIIDGGAHIGLAAVWFSLQFPQAWVDALEPADDNFAMLWHNTTSSGLRIIPLRLGLSSLMQPLSVRDGGTGNWGYRAVPDIDGDATGVTMEHMLERDPTRWPPFIVKLDIEGAEAEVLDVAWVRCVPVVIAELHGWVEDKSRFGVLYDGRETWQLGENIVSVDRGLLCAR